MNAIHPADDEVVTRLDLTHLLKSKETINPVISVAESVATDTHAERRPGLDNQPQARLQPADRASVPTVAGDPAVAAAKEAAGAIMQIDNVKTLADSRDAAALFFDLLKKSEHLPAIVGMPDGCHGRALDHHEADPDIYAGDCAEEPAPDFVMISIEPGFRAWTFRFTAEMSFKAVAVVGKFGAALFPFFGLVEAEQKRERERAAREAKYNARLDRLERAGRIAFHRARKAGTREEYWEILAAIGRQFALRADAIDLARLQYGKIFLARARKRRNARIWRLHIEGLHDREIANHPLVKVSITTVKNVLGKRKRQR